MMYLTLLKLDESRRLMRFSVKSGIIGDIWTSIFTVLILCHVCCAVSESQNSNTSSANIVDYLISSNINISDANELYIKLIMNDYGQNGVLSLSEIESLINSISHRDNINSNSNRESALLCNNSPRTNTLSCVQNTVSQFPRVICHSLRITTTQSKQY